MLDKYILSKLTNKGKWCFWLIQLTLTGGLYVYLTYFSSSNSIQSNGLGYLLIGIFFSVAISAFISLRYFRKSDEE